MSCTVTSLLVIFHVIFSFYGTALCHPPRLFPSISSLFSQPHITTADKVPSVREAGHVHEAVFYYNLYHITLTIPTDHCACARGDPKPVAFYEYPVVQLFFLSFSDMYVNILSVPASRRPALPSSPQVVH